jgi:hypothetical protein
LHAVRASREQQDYGTCHANYFRPFVQVYANPHWPAITHGLGQLFDINTCLLARTHGMPCTYVEYLFAHTFPSKLVYAPSLASLYAPIGTRRRVSPWALRGAVSYVELLSVGKLVRILVVWHCVNEADQIGAGTSRPYPHVSAL